MMDTIKCKLFDMFSGKVMKNRDESELKQDILSNTPLINKLLKTKNSISTSLSLQNSAQKFIMSDFIIPN